MGQFVASRTWFNRSVTVAMSARHILAAMVAVVLATTASAISAGSEQGLPPGEVPDYGAASPAERASRIAALTAAYAAMDENRLASRGKHIYLTPRAGMIVVSFLNSRAGVHGGQSHLTFDPRLGRVVKVVAEE